MTYLMQKFLSIIFLLIFFICGCGGPVQQNIATAKIPAQTVSQPPSGKEPYGKNLYRNKENHFSIIFPEGWEQSGGRGPNVVVVSKNKTGESINIIVKELPEQFKKYTFENFSKLQLQVEHFGKMAITSSNIKAVEKCIEKFFRGLIAKPLTRATIQFIGKMQHIVRTIVFNRNTFGDVLA